MTSRTSDLHMSMIDGESETAVGDSNLARASTESEPVLLSPPPTSTAAAQRRKSAPTNPFARFNFLSRSKAESTPMHDEPPVAPDDSVSNSNTVLRPVKGRKRKGSLRKTALLGPARAAKVEASPTESLHSHEEIASIDEAVHQALSAPPQHLPRRLSLVSEDSTTTSPPNATAPTDPSSPIISPTSQSYASTTDDDDLSMAAPASILSNTPTSYFNTAPPIPRRRSSHKPTPSPLSALPVLSPTPTDPHSYSETSRWGWVLLCSTWVIFTVGMGSCLGVWSWAWDVGQTPYAPPELEDDPTLPIVGYYPALIILSAVMAWVWVVVAWVGMKYFKHAKIQGDDD